MHMLVKPGDGTIHETSGICPAPRSLQAAAMERADGGNSHVQAADPLKIGRTPSNVV